MLKNYNIYFSSSFQFKGLKEKFKMKKIELKQYETNNIDFIGTYCCM